MFINTKITLAAALVLGAASAALSNDIDVNPSSAQSAREWAQQRHENTFASNACPELEGYPDCHPDGRAPWTQYSTTGEFMAHKKIPAKFKGMVRESEPKGGNAIPAPM